MKISKLFSTALVAGASLSAQAGVLLTETFDNLAASGWTQVGGNGWFQGNSGVFPAYAGPADSYAGNNYLSSTTSISEWLMSPVLNLTGGATLEFALRLLGDGFLDTVEVYTSNAGASTDVADFSTLVGSFSSSTDTGWTLESLALSAFSGRIGFRYVAADTNTDGNYIGIDSVSVIPEPTSVALVALALAGVAATRRRT